ncbi:hypothetical protein GDO78_015353 [Eleutherodactylus coqui]|uniref:Complement factor B n=1 Tax=Eleutherodactylus coqui TaxID=57060 RepID=A0A8J6EDP7_ELECQ|nr:hypothetical protein GDO78_015353 [Eleutherodactylus coqui]
MFENGEFYPRKVRYFVGDILEFECWGGFKMFGPVNRTCQSNGKWSGKITVCDDQDGDCPNPGIPLGARKVGTSYNIEATVKYTCEPGMEMLGSKERVCKEDKSWSAAEPSCRYWYTFDTPKEVAESFSASISETIEASDPNRVEGRRTRHKMTSTMEYTYTGDFMNIFIIIDASKSVKQKNFKIAKDVSEVFIDTMASYDFTPQYAVISYASYAKPAVLLSDDDSTDAEAVIERIKNLKYSEHEDKQGTNTRAALYKVREMLSLQHVRDPKKFMEMRNVILLMTDGKHNMGGDPNLEIKYIKQMLNIRKNNTREDYLDVYVFGLGEDTDKTEINELASNKRGETHVFPMKSIGDLLTAFSQMLDETPILQMCGLSREFPPDEQEDVQEKFPWIAKITITRAGSQEKCKGSIVSKFFILTAAHCFYIDDAPRAISVSVGDKTFKVKNLHRHEKYDPAGKQDKKLANSFDYDVALIELQEKIEFSQKIRPICLPCTNGTSWALKQAGKPVKCHDHVQTLLSGELVKAMFVAEEKEKALQRKDVFIKRGNKRLACLDDTKKIEKFKDIPDIKDAVTDNFLCTGGIEPEVDPQTCKGDSGGPLIVPFKRRYIQVGIISWGTINSCNVSKRRPGPVPALSRDFHTDVSRMMDWIREKLKDEGLEFLV